tara:strand:+ start:434 stop:541 length:108 start_codon:yes stop_codon:yes gene_type:complete
MITQADIELVLSTEAEFITRERVDAASKDEKIGCR